MSVRRRPAQYHCPATCVLQHALLLVLLLQTSHARAAVRRRLLGMLAHGQNHDVRCCLGSLPTTAARLAPAADAAATLAAAAAAAVPEHLQIWSVLPPKCTVSSHKACDLQCTVLFTCLRRLCHWWVTFVSYISSGTQSNLRAATQVLQQTAVCYGRSDTSLFMLGNCSDGIAVPPVVLLPLPAAAAAPALLLLLLRCCSQPANSVSKRANPRLHAKSGPCSS